ncbi:hypothetical protein [Acuticoccus sp. I52.16.1]|uniref:hypothetical protein n=1 Tax=Acuticoccus sp. I52.16.1 TaxID=2928472 RepID=UPI001FD3BF2E|nr:hypothetical protein [Acuticoccus sp. I52.16.1]UOM37078.1 hypothetical protein MRB58_23645 [Acuticoccus sp. I52.16.1]
MGFASIGADAKHQPVGLTALFISNGVISKRPTGIQERSHNIAEQHLSLCVWLPHATSPFQREISIEIHKPRGHDDARSSESEVYNAALTQNVKSVQIEDLDHFMMLTFPSEGYALNEASRFARVFCRYALDFSTSEGGRRARSTVAKI